MIEQKFQLFEMVRIINDHTESLTDNIGFISKVLGSPWGGECQYSVFMRERSEDCDFFESALESTGEFLSDEDREAYRQLTDFPHYLDFREIVEILYDEDETLVGRKGYVVGMAQCYREREWFYMLHIIGTDLYRSGFIYKNLRSTGEFFEEPYEEPSRLRVTKNGEVTDVYISNPQHWGELNLTPDRITGWKDEEE